MDSHQVASIVARELDTFEYSPSPDTIGTPWSAERMAKAVSELREALIEPEQRPITRHPPEVRAQSSQNLWVVAVTDDGFLLFFDPSVREFGLALEAEGGLPVSIGVYGDLVGTFCAR